jgi:O-methyltransferase
MKYAAQRLANRLGYRVSRLYGPDLGPELRATIAAARPHTTTQNDAIVSLHDTVAHVVDVGIPGALVECGVWKGGSLLVMARTLVERGVTDRDLYGFDTFTGMPAATQKDVRYDGMLGTDPSSMNLDVAPSAEHVRELVLTSCYPAHRLHLVEGPVEETVPAAAPAEIALLRLDTDWYESTRHELEHLYPRLSPGGILIVDDYGHWEGARQATDEYFTTLDRRPFLSRVDYAVRLAVKP